MLGQLHQQHLGVWRCGAIMKDGVLSFTAVSLTIPPPPPFFFFVCFVIFISAYVSPVASPESIIPVWRRSDSEL